ncbi:MAG: TerB family tellurite resistance protein [Ekhidna sp.]|nr:TerB family tellurite resistance protein [Ekhidna sp.]
MKNQHETLLEEYHKTRKSDLTIDQFTYLLKIYPSLLVCMSDGKLDKEEWDGVLNISKGLALLYLDQMPNTNAEQIESLFRTEFRYLLENIDKWEKKFLNTLKSYLEEHSDDKEFVYEAMYLFANAADGISADEQRAIDRLSSRLALEY